MKMTSKQMVKISAIYHDYVCIENADDLIEDLKQAFKS